MLLPLSRDKLSSMLWYYILHMTSRYMKKVLCILEEGDYVEVGIGL
jgi:hypothetical protein